MGDMPQILRLLLWVGVTVSTPVDLQKRIIGGAICGNGERRYHVKLVDRNDNLMCGGSLISEKWVLTAAHCWERGMKAVLDLHPGPGDGHPEGIKSHKIFRKWKYVLFSKKHDIMLLELKNAIDPTLVQPIPLPNQQDCEAHPNVGDTVQVAGYASTMMDPITHERLPGDSPTLQCVDLQIMDSTAVKQCMKNSNSRRVRKKAKEHWSLYRAPRRDTSPGDSGGGVVFDDKIYGVHVFSLNRDYACVAPAGFMDVCEYLPWINEIINPRPKSCLNCG